MTIEYIDLRTASPTNNLQELHCYGTTMRLVTGDFLSTIYEVTNIVRIVLNILNLYVMLLRALCYFSNNHFVGKVNRSRQIGIATVN